MQPIVGNNRIYLYNRAIGITVADRLGPEFLHTWLGYVEPRVTERNPYRCYLKPLDRDGDYSILEVFGPANSIIRFDVSKEDRTGETYLVNQETPWEESYMDPLALRAALAIIAKKRLGASNLNDRFSPLDFAYYRRAVYRAFERGTTFVNSAGRLNTTRRPRNENDYYKQPMFIVAVARAHMILPKEYRRLFFAADNVISLRRV